MSLPEQLKDRIATKDEVVVMCSKCMVISIITKKKYEKHLVNGRNTDIRCDKCNHGWLVFFLAGGREADEKILSQIGTHKLTRSEIGTNAYYDNDHEHVEPRKRSWTERFYYAFSVLHGRP